MAEASATLDLADRTREADRPHSPVVRFAPSNPLRLDCGVDFGPLQIAFQTYGTLNAERTNAVLVCHALTGDQHVLNTHPVTGKPGWWETMVRSGLDQSGDRDAVGPRLSRHHRARHGARAGHAARSSRHRFIVRGRRRLD